MIQPTWQEVQPLAFQLGTDYRRALMKPVARQAKWIMPYPGVAAGKPASLRGIGQVKFREDSDIETMVRRIRSAWLDELDEMDPA
jgi:hypothetical protein